MFFTFLPEKLFEKNFLVEYLRSNSALQAASAYKKKEFWRATHTPLRLLTGRIIFLTREKTPFASPVVRSSDWLELIRL